MKIFFIIFAAFSAGAFFGFIIMALIAAGAKSERLNEYETETANKNNM